MCQLTVQFVITHRFLHYRFLTYGFQARTRNMDCNYDDNDEYDYYDFPRRNYDDNDDYNYNFLRRNYDDNDDRCGSTTCCRLRSRGCPGWRTRCATPSHASVTNCHHHFQQTQNHHLIICSCVWVIFSRLGNTQIRTSQSSSSNHLHPCQNLFGENCFKIAVPGLDNVQTDHFIYSLLCDFYSSATF